MEHQDWTTLVFKKRELHPYRYDTTQKTTPKYSASRNTQEKHVNALMVERKIEDDTFALPKVSYNLQLQIQQARQSKQWTQKQLAQACNLPEATIRDYENGKIIPKNQDICRMSKILGVRLSNK